MYPTAPGSLSELDTANRDTDPIRFPNAIQPHGVLLVVRRPSGIIEAASETCQRMLGVAAETLLGRSVGDIVGPSLQRALLGDPGDGRQPLLPLSLNGNRLQVRPRVNDSGLVLIDMELETGVLSPGLESIYYRRGVLTGLTPPSDVPEIARQSTALIRGITDFDRIMLCRFDESWNGEVIGEARIEGIDPYLGLKFPAGDLPNPARDLFRGSRMRSIPDVLYTPSPLIAQNIHQCIDLGPSTLRSVSPSHVEYLRTIEVRATLVGSLMVEGRHWGQVWCHHKSGPKYLAPSFRDTLAWLFDNIASMIETVLIRQRRSREIALRVRRRHLADTLRSADLKELMNAPHSTDVLGVMAANGFALIAHGSIHTTGHAPSPERLRVLQHKRRQFDKTSTVYASIALVRDLAIDDGGDGVAGAVFVSLRDDADVTLIWFRDEHSVCVHWTRDPGRGAAQQSFAPFTQNVRGQCLPWTVEELDSAAELGSLIEIVALREREAFAQTILNSSPQHVAILDAEGVIVSVNDAWSRFARLNTPGTVISSVGSSYKSECLRAMRNPLEVEAAQALRGIESVLNGTAAYFTLDYPCDSPQQARRYRMTVYPMIAPAAGAVVAHEDITARVSDALALKKANERAALAIHGGGIGIWDLNIETGALLGTRRCIACMA